jgi:hypothetical protein
MPCDTANSYSHETTPEPDRQFALVREHIDKLRRDLYRSISRVKIYVERNLGFEAEHHQRALGDYPGVEFYVDAHASRVGVLTTNETKHAMATVCATMMRERRIHVAQPLISSRDPVGSVVRLREQAEMYSYQFKSAINTFTQDRVALSGKVGGCHDDLIICLQLGVYWTNVEIAQKRHIGNA